MNILTFGDSIVLGLWDENGGWVGRLTKDLVKEALTSNLEEDYEVYNLGVSGDTTAGLLQRFEFEIKQRLGEFETAFVFAIGINDSEYCHSTGQMKVPPDKFRQNIIQLITLAGKYSDKMVFIGLTPVDETRVDPIPWATDFSYRNEFVKQYDAIIKDVCRKNNILYLGVFDNLMKSGFIEMLADGVHPNSRGHDLIFKIVDQKLLKLLLTNSGRNR